jgi:hypothetical protein
MTDVAVVPVVAGGDTYQIDGQNLKDYFTGELANVAFTGNYTDISGAPTAVSSFTNDAGYVTSSTANVISVNGSGGVVTVEEYANAKVQAYLPTYSGNLSPNNVSLSGNITGNTAGFAIGYRDIPVLSLAANTTISTSDAGKQYYSTSASALTLTIANNASQAFSTGATINLINQGAANISVTRGVGVTLYLAGNSTSSDRTVTSFGVASITKVSTDTWFIAGVGII